MIRRTFFQAVLLTVAFCVTAFAQTDFFWSFSDMGATNSDANGGFAQGESGSLFLYYSTNGPGDSGLDSFFLDIAASNHGAINFTGSEVFNFDVGGDDRWDAVFPGKIAGDMQSIDELGASGGVGVGNSGNSGLDDGYDVGSDAFLMARIDFTYLGGFTEIVTTAGAGGIVHDGQAIYRSFVWWCRHNRDTRANRDRSRGDRDFRVGAAAKKSLLTYLIACRISMLS